MSSYWWVVSGHLMNVTPILSVCSSASASTGSGSSPDVALLIAPVWSPGLSRVRWAFRVACCWLMIFNLLIKSCLHMLLWRWGWTSTTAPNKKVHAFEVIVKTHHPLIYKDNTLYRLAPIAAVNSFRRLKAPHGIVILYHYSCYQYRIHAARPQRGICSRRSSLNAF